jgi:hypothetical protein
MISRREFLRYAPLAGLGLAGVLRPRRLFARNSIHPDPRPGIDGSMVTSAEALEGLGDDIIAIYDMVREIPQIADGIGCYCGCSVRPGYRSLLTCYYEDGMAMGCRICQGQARLAYRRHGEGQTLDQIRRAIDARFG